MGTTRHFHVVFDVRVLDLNLSTVDVDRQHDFSCISARKMYRSKTTISRTTWNSVAVLRVGVEARAQLPPILIGLLSH